MPSIRKIKVDDTVYDVGAATESIVSVIPQYYLSDSPDVVTGGSWSPTPPEWEEDKYVWKRQEYTVLSSSGVTSTEYSTPVYYETLTQANSVALEAKTNAADASSAANEASAIASSAQSDASQAQTGVTSLNTKVDSLEDITSEMSGDINNFSVRLDSVATELNGLTAPQTGELAQINQRISDNNAPIEAWFDFGAGQLVIGDKDSSVKVGIGYDSSLGKQAITLMQNGDAIAYVADNKFYFVGEEVVKTLQIGDYVISQRPNGHLTCQWKSNGGDN